MEERRLNRRVGQWFSNQVSWFTFLLSLLVIWVHSLNAELFLGTGAQALRVGRWESVLSEHLGQIAVPGFFMASAYLFYRDFSWSCLAGKWKSRVKSLLLPYFLWNFLYYVGYVTATRLPLVGTLVGKEPVPFGLWEMLLATVYYRYNPVFWYLFQLLLLVLLAPVLYELLKRTLTGSLFLAALIFALWNNWNLSHLNMDALFYYSFAAFAALHRNSWGGFVEKRSEAIAGTALFFIAAGAALFLGKCGAPLLRQPFYTVLQRFWGVCAFTFVLKQLPLPKARQWMKNNFFLYAIHFAWVRFFNKLSVRLLPATSASAFGMFLVMPFLTLGISMLLGRWMKRWVPVLYFILSGGR